MHKKAISSAKAPKAVGPYSQAIEVGGLIFCSGQIHIDPKTNELVDGPIEELTKVVLNNLKAVLKEAGADMDHVMKTTIYLADINDFVKVNEVYASFFKEPYPTRATVQVAKLPKGAKVEIEAIAYVNPYGHQHEEGHQCQCGDGGCC